MVHTVTIKIADKGSPTSGGGTSAKGRMWYEVSDGVTTISYGFGPDPAAL